MSIRESVLIIYYKNMKYDVGTFGCFFVNMNILGENSYNNYL